MGSGLKNLGDSLLKRKINNFDIFLSHFHYDHTCGLPFLNLHLVLILNLI